MVMVAMEAVMTMASMMGTNVKAGMPSPGLRVVHIPQNETHDKYTCSEHPASCHWLSHHTPSLSIYKRNTCKPDFIAWSVFAAASLAT